MPRPLPMSGRWPFWRSSLMSPSWPSVKSPRESSSSRNPSEVGEICPQNWTGSGGRPSRYDRPPVSATFWSPLREIRTAGSTRGDEHKRRTASRLVPPPPGRSPSDNACDLAYSDFRLAANASSSVCRLIRTKRPMSFISVVNHRNKCELMQAKQMYSYAATASLLEVFCGRPGNNGFPTTTRCSKVSSTHYV